MNYAMAFIGQNRVEKRCHNWVQSGCDVSRSKMGQVQVGLGYWTLQSSTETQKDFYLG